MIGRLLGAFQFLTVLPIRRATAAAGESALFFPLVGWALGFAGGLLLQSTRTLIPTPLASLVVLAFWAFLTGALHEDGFADVFDGFRAGRPRERILAILKDSRIGAHGALALVLVTVLRWQALISFVGDPVRSLSAIFAVSRASIAALAWISPPAGDGLGFEFSRTLTGAIVMGAILQALFFACFGGAALLLCGGTVLIVLAARRYFVARIGGVTGDCLGATGFLVETWGFVLFACQRCM